MQTMMKVQNKRLAKDIERNDASIPDNYAKQNPMQRGSTLQKIPL